MSTGDTALHISRMINAPPAKVWTAWSRPEHLARWWIPAPIACEVVKLDLWPGGGFETRMREPGKAFGPHLTACFLEIVPERRLVWTTALGEGWKPIEPWLTLTAVIGLEPEGSGTRYSARVMHKTAADSRRHQELGFEEGWGTTIDQLAAFAERLD